MQTLPLIMSKLREAINRIEPKLLIINKHKHILWNNPRGTRLTTTLAHCCGFYGSGKRCKENKVYLGTGPAPTQTSHFTPRIILNFKGKVQCRHMSLDEVIKAKGLESARNNFVKIASTHGTKAAQLAVGNAITGCLTRALYIACHDIINRYAKVEVNLLKQLSNIDCEEKIQHFMKVTGAASNRIIIDSDPVHMDAFGEMGENFTLGTDHNQVVSMCHVPLHTQTPFEDYGDTEPETHTSKSQNDALHALFDTKVGKCTAIGSRS